MTMFCLALDLLIRSADNMDDPLTVDDVNFNILAYADDLVVFGKTGEKLEERVNNLVDLATQGHLLFKPGKYGYFSINPCERISLSIFDEEIPVIDKK